jgi:hypothetical protein
MSKYLVRFSIGKNNVYVYPATTAGAVWKQAIYHHKQLAMVGETDNDIKADGKLVKRLDSAGADRLIKEFMASYPKLIESPRLLPTASPGPRPRRKAVRKDPADSR